MDEAVKGLTQYREDVVSGAYPTPAHCIKIKDDEFSKFMQAIAGHDPNPVDASPLRVPKRKKMTVADLIACKGKRQIVVVTAFDLWTAQAAEAAGVDMILAWGSDLEHSKYVIGEVRRGAPNTLIGSGINPGAYVSQEEALRIANEIRAAGTDIIYCSGLVPEKFAGLRKQHFPCCGHVGYLPVNDTWYGGPRAVGKTADEAKKIYDDVMALEAAGCIAVEMECVPAKVAAEIAKRTKLLVFSMGSGPDCDGQFIFAEDLLGSHSGHYPRHSITYAHLMDEAVKGLTQYREDVVSGAYPTPAHCIKIKDDEFSKFMQAMIN
jgi:3-methyl-2-oxobutanoate hydroxymethyltransferase